MGFILMHVLFGYALVSFPFKIAGSFGMKYLELTLSDMEICIGME